MMYIQSFAVAGRTYLANHPTNRYEWLRLWLAKRLIKWGRKLLLNNAEMTVTTGSSRCPFD